MTKLTFSEAEEYLNSLLTFGIKLGLENMQVLNKLLGDPASSLKFVHVAGTNGKGSTCAMIATACKYSGLKTGFYSSPFLVNFLERWRINGSPIQQEVYLKAMAQIISIEDELKAITGVRPTYFEVLTAAALLIFKEQQCDIVIWETGMGGRLDATNIVDPLLTIITNIAMDHSQYLGETLLEVAGEKAGIIKDGSPFICGERKAELRSFFAERAQNCKSYFIDTDFQASEINGIIEYRSEQSLSYELSLNGPHQVSNSALAVKALEVLEDLKVIDSASKAAKGIVYAHWPGRIQKIEPNIYIDGAHNPAAMQELKKFLGEEKVTVICGMMKDKEINSTLAELSDNCSRFIAVTIDIPRAIKADELAKIAAQILSVPCSHFESLKEALIHIRGKTLITGSLYLAGEALGQLAPETALKCDLLNY